MKNKKRKLVAVFLTSLITLLFDYLILVYLIYYKKFIEHILNIFFNFENNYYTLYLYLCTSM